MQFQSRVRNAAALLAVGTLFGFSSKAPAQQAAAKLDDPTIIAIFDAANTYDIETGSLAARKATSGAVKEFGAMIARDHENVRAQGRALAKSLNVTPTPPANFGLATAHAQAMKSLRAKSGKDFDRAFLQQEIDFHNAVIDAVTKILLPSIQNPQVKDLVTKVAPAFVAHRDRAQALLNGLK